MAEDDIEVVDVGGDDGAPAIRGAWRDPLARMAALIADGDEWMPPAHGGALVPQATRARWRSTCSPSICAPRPQTRLLASRAAARRGS